MNIVPIMGGMGNQMFMYAFYLAVKNKNEKTYCSECLLEKDKAHYGYDLFRAFNISTDRSFILDFLLKFLSKLHRYTNVLDNPLLKKIGFHFIKDNYMYDSDNIKENKGISLYRGYWQSELYFKEINIHDYFKFDVKKLTIEALDILNIINKTEESVSIHIRRGDFLDLDISLQDKYYLKAISLIEKKISNPRFFIFSDDLNYVKRLNIPNSLIVDCNNNENSWMDMFLMSNCKHNIIANSTFSWWGAYLNQNIDKIVIAPTEIRNFNKDILPESFIVI